MRFGIVFILALIFSQDVMAQSKFDRPKKKKDKEVTQKTQKEEKVDISDLENRYWTAKDTEFNVVQNRVYTKEKRFSVTPQIGPIFNDPYTDSMNFGLAVNYYFSERTGVELTWLSTSARDAELISRVGSNGAYPDHNTQKMYIGAAYNWIPIYAKLSFLEKKILYFDMSVSPGIGVTTLSSSHYTTSTSFTPPAAKTQTQVTLSLDVAQQVFLSEHWAIRLDLRNHFYQEKIYGSVSGSELNTKFTYSGTVMLGVTFFK
ncbi:MAG: outer membrane beta-barrel domain-containing protein [Oligoflexia bacterium]|nr:outer membrane beta-barrel domain-containing protein [Oligoflexia bacterium]